MMKYIPCLPVIFAKIRSFGWVFGVQIPPHVWCLEAQKDHKLYIAGGLPDGPLWVPRHV